jgi:hypothetical protein
VLLTRLQSAQVLDLTPGMADGDGVVGDCRALAKAVERCDSLSWLVVKSTSSGGTFFLPLGDDCVGASRPFPAELVETTVVLLLPIRLLELLAAEGPELEALASDDNLTENCRDRLRDTVGCICGGAGPSSSSVWIQVGKESITSNA